MGKLHALRDVLMDQGPETVVATVRVHSGS
jgi:hypothetical protein